MLVVFVNYAGGTMHHAEARKQCGRWMALVRRKHRKQCGWAVALVRRKHRKQCDWAVSLVRKKHRAPMEHVPPSGDRSFVKYRTFACQQQQQTGTVEKCNTRANRVRPPACGGTIDRVASQLFLEYPPEH